MGGRGLDHLIEQNETDLGFLSAYGGGESPEELLRLVSQSICEEMSIIYFEGFTSKLDERIATVSMSQSIINKVNMIKNLIN